MPERRVPTLADAQRQVLVRGFIGGLLIGLGLVFLLLFLVKDLYLSDSPFSTIPGDHLRRLINPLVREWLILDLLWRAIPPSQPMPTVPTTPLWDYVYPFWGAGVVVLVGGLLLLSARTRRAVIAEYDREMQREAWRQQARAAGGVAPYDRGPTTVIGQAVWYEYPAPPESWSQTLRGILILGLIVALISGFILLYAEYSFFQPHWPSSRN